MRPLILASLLLATPSFAQDEATELDRVRGQIAELEAELVRLRARERALTRDPRLRWTAELTSDSKGSGQLADLNGDGVADVVFGTYYGDEHLYALNGADGTLLWKHRSDGGPLDASVAIADLDGDGSPEVLAADSATGTLFCLDAEGTLRWSLKLPSGTDSPPAVGDLDGDGKPEVVVGAMWDRSGDGSLVAIDPRSQETLWKQQLSGCVQSEPALVDLDADGALDVIVTSWRGDRGVHAFRGGDGKALWSLITDGDGESMGMYHGVSVSGAGKSLRVLAATCQGDVYAIDAVGAVLWKQHLEGEYLFPPTTTADLDGDGASEVVVCGRESVYVLSVATGEELWSRTLEGGLDRGAAVVDLGSDGVLDLVVASGTRLWALRGDDGAVLVDYEAALDAQDRYESISSAPLVLDVDGDGTLEAFLVTGRGYSGELQAKNRGQAQLVELGPGTGAWTTFRGGLLRRGGAE
jgi:outer membrane protein assembly factor BamB